MGRFSSLVSAADLARRWCFDPTWWFPPACPCCGSPNVADAPCPLCEARLFGAGTPPETIAPDGTPVRAAAWFESDVRDVLHRLKFGRDTHAARAFPQRMAMVAADLIPACDVVVPMPLSLRRRLLRGFNQAEVLAELLSETCGLPMGVGRLSRAHRPPQSGLDREARLRNLVGAFRGRGVAGARVMLVDDVVTTGATLAAAAAALRQAGAASIVAVVAARTPDQK